MTRLAGKIALVTGAGSGIGAAIADRFAELGAFLVATDVDASAAEATARRIRDSGGNAEAMGLDVTSDDEAGTAARTVHGRHQRLDILVNNAGIGHVGTILQASGADLDRLYSVNVRGVFNVTKAFLPAMIERPPMASVAAG